MIITHKAQVPGYMPHVWFDQKSIADLIALNDIINKYCITYDILDEMFIVHWEEHVNHHIHFIMHDIGLNYYDPEDEYFLLDIIVIGNKESYSNRYIKASEQVREMYTYLGFP